MSDLVEATYVSWRDDRTIRLGAGLAYYGLFSLSSFVAISFGIVRIIGSSGSFETALVDRAEHAFGDAAASSIAAMLGAFEGSAGTQIGLIGLGSLLITGSLFFLALEDALNQIWHVPVRAGLRSSVRRRLTSLLVLLSAAVTLVVALGIQAVTGVLEKLLPGAVPGVTLLSSLLTTAIGWALLVAAITLLFRFVPSIDVPARPIAVAAAITSGFLIVGTALVGWYLRTIGASSLGGVASTPIIVLAWIYYEAQILLAGAQLSKILSESPQQRTGA